MFWMSLVLTSNLIWCIVSIGLISFTKTVIEKYEMEVLYFCNNHTATSTENKLLCVSERLRDLFVFFIADLYQIFVSLKFCAILSDIYNFSASFPHSLSCMSFSLIFMNCKNVHVRSKLSQTSQAKESNLI